MYHQETRVETGEASSGKIINFVGLSVGKTKVVQPTYLNNVERYFFVASDEIEGACGSPMKSHAVAEDFKHATKSGKY